MEKVKKGGEIVRETAKAAVVHGGRKVLLIAAGAVVPVRQREDNLTDVSAAERPDFSGGSRGSLKDFAQELVNLTYYVIPITPPSAHGMVLSLMV